VKYLHFKGISKEDPKEIVINLNTHVCVARYVSGMYQAPSTSRPNGMAGSILMNNLTTCMIN
jgi:hypothetical protein